MFILWLYQNLFWPNLVWHLTCHIIVKILESCLITVCVLWSWFLFAIVLCVCARPRVCEGERVWVFFVCLFCMPCVEWVWMFLVLLFYVIYSRTIASIANVFCWLYPTLNKVYLILSYLVLISSHGLQWMWLLIHAGIKVKPAGTIASLKIASSFYLAYYEYRLCIFCRFLIKNSSARLKLDRILGGDESAQRM